MTINLNVSDNHLSYAVQQAANDDVSIGKVIEQSLAMYQLYRTGKIGIIHECESYKVHQEESKTIISDRYWTTESETGNLIQEREVAD